MCARGFKSFFFLLNKLSSLLPHNVFKNKELRPRYSLDQVEFIQNNMPYNNNKIKQTREIFLLCVFYVYRFFLQLKQQHCSRVMKAKDSELSRNTCHQVINGSTGEN